MNDYNNPNYLAHYTSLDTAKDYILKNNTIKISNIKNVNDPYENTIDWFDICPLGHTPHFESEKYLKTIKEDLSNNLKLFCTTGYKEHVPYSVDQTIYGKPAMWSHYGDNHKGVCLIFNKKKLEMIFKAQKYQFCFSNEVSYNEYLEEISSGVTIESKELLKISDHKKLLEIINQNYLLEHYYFRKHTDWSNEQEYRWLIFDDCKNDTYLHFENALEAIVLGSKFDVSFYETFKEFDFPIYKLSLSCGKYTLSKF